MDARDLDRLLKTLRKHGVTSFEDGAGLKVAMTGEPSEPGEPALHRRNAPGVQSTAEIGLGDLPDLDDGDGDPRTFIQQLAARNNPQAIAQQRAHAAAQTKGGEPS